MLLLRRVSYYCWCCPIWAQDALLHRSAKDVDAVGQTEYSQILFRFSSLSLSLLSSVYAINLLCAKGLSGAIRGEPYEHLFALSESLVRHRNLGQTYRFPLKTVCCHPPTLNFSLGIIQHHHHRRPKRDRQRAGAMESRLKAKGTWTHKQTPLELAKRRRRHVDTVSDDIGRRRWRRRGVCVF